MSLDLERHESGSGGQADADAAHGGTDREAGGQPPRRSVGWRFVFSRRWFGYAAFAVAFAIACVFLSHWQASRSAWAAAQNTQTAANFYSTPRPFSEGIPSKTAWPVHHEWLRVEVSGTYEPSKQLYVRNRPLNSVPGFEVLTPLRLADGSTFIVDRGWVGTASNVNYPAKAAAPPPGKVTVIVRVKPTEPKFGSTPTIKDQIQTIELHQVASHVGGSVYTSAYGLLDRYVSQKPAHVLRSVQTSMPVANQGMYLSYMIQWIIFALIGFFALGYGIRTEYRKLNEDDPEERAREEERLRRRALKRPNDAQEEDALLDSTGG